MKNFKQSDMIKFLHNETKVVLEEMTEVCFCRKAGIKSRGTLRNFVQSGQISSLDMMSKIARGCGFKVKYSFRKV